MRLLTRPASAWFVILLGNYKGTNLIWYNQSIPSMQSNLTAYSPPMLSWTQQNAPLFFYKNAPLISLINALLIALISAFPRMNAPLFALLLLREVPNIAHPRRPPLLPWPRPSRSMRLSAWFPNLIKFVCLGLQRRPCWRQDMGWSKRCRRWQR
jgi:hypothetical protein